MANDGVVWVLGAGFSRPLGAPLLNDFFSEAEGAQLAHYLSQGECFYGADALERLRAIYKEGKSTHCWSDPEQFLVWLSAAASFDTPSTHPMVKYIHDKLRIEIASMLYSSDSKLVGLRVAHQIAAASVSLGCSWFLEEAEKVPVVVDQAEQWLPYREWAKSLRPGDTVITFNYDRVPDLLQKHCGARFSRPALGESVDERRRLGCTPLLNMHGSVGWLTKADGGIEASDRAVAHVHPDRAILGIPGHGKTRLASEQLMSSWCRGMAAIESAAAVVFVGYRFPESDNKAKCEILGALRRNQKAKLHFVLGDNSPDAGRLQQLLLWTRLDARPSHGIIDQNMKTQDFLVAFDRDGLLAY